MPWDHIAHAEKVRKLKLVEQRRLKNYWPFYWECNTCDAPEGKPCWNLHDRKNSLGRPSKDWKYNLGAHAGRVRMTKAEFKVRQEELAAQRLEEHKTKMQQIKREAQRYGIYID